MTMEEILAGESKNVEFKESLPEKSIKYMKSVVAFANGVGGKIIFGISDKTNEVVGVDKDNVFGVKDAIANAISDSCAPAIIPDITLRTIEEKTVIVVEISEGRQRPYYIKTLGKEEGVYIRVAGTTRLADAYMVKELMFEGSNRCFDQNICHDCEISDEDIDCFCCAMKDEAMKNTRNEVQKASIKDVGKQQLCSWGVLAQKDGKFYPTYAYTILTGCGALHIATQCGVFKGTTKETFVDRREYTGMLWEQIEEAYQFVLRNIHMGSVFEGIYRQDMYEIPPDAIRELIINAAVHRSYLDHGNIQIAIYDDRLEITSPGKIPMGQTLERMKEGYSKIRNEALAHAFFYMNLIEHWGSGIPRIIGKVKAAGLKEPEFIGGDVDLRINIYRGQKKGVDFMQHSVSGIKNADKMPLKANDCRENAVKVPINEQEKKIHQFVIENGFITTIQTAELLRIKKRRAREILGKMVEKDWLKKEGASRSTVYIINTERSVK